MSSLVDVCGFVLSLIDGDCLVVCVRLMMYLRMLLVILMVVVDCWVVWIFLVDMMVLMFVSLCGEKFLVCCWSIEILVLCFGMLMISFIRNWLS